MDTRAALDLANSLLYQHGLQDWRITLDRATSRVGVTRHSTKTIGLSAPLVALNDSALIRNTILHEIAHALVGPGAGHGPVWRRKAREIGCDAKRTASNAVTPPKRYMTTCETCGRSAGRSKRPQAGSVYRCQCSRGNAPLVWVDTALVKA